MNKIARIATVAGMGALAALAIGAGPAQAAVSSPQSAVKTATVQAPQFHGGGDVVGVYSSPIACDVAGRIGERFDRWESFDCGIIGFGGGWALRVERDFTIGGHGWGHDGGFGHGGGFGHDCGCQDHSGHSDHSMPSHHVKSHHHHSKPSNNAPTTDTGTKTNGGGYTKPATAPATAGYGSKR